MSEDHVLGVIFRFDSHTDDLCGYEGLTVRNGDAWNGGIGD